MPELDLNSEEVKAAIKKAAEEMVATQHEGLVKNRDQLLAEKREMADKLKMYEGVDPAKFKEMQQQQEELENERLRKEKDFDKLLQNQAEKLNGEIKARDERLNKMTSMLQKEKIHATAVEAISKHKGTPDLLLPHVTARVRLNDDMELEVLSREGTPMFDNQGKRAGIESLITEFKADPVFSRAFDVDTKGGTGARNSSGFNGGGRPETNPFEKDEKTGKWRDLQGAMTLRKSDPDAAKSMAEEAGVDTSHWS